MVKRMALRAQAMEEKRARRGCEGSMRKGPVMSSPYSSMETINAAHGAHTLVIDPHVATAIWAIVLALACALVVIIAEMVKKQRTESAEVKRRRRKTPPS